LEMWTVSVRGNTGSGFLLMEINAGVCWRV
jgi:hypothetical protein